MPELDRRDFLKLVGVGAGAAATACAEPVEKLVPYVEQPESITPGIAVWYASTCDECPAGCGLHVKTREGRPIKLEGNPDHPINRGKLCARGQAGLGRTYLPDRYPQPMVSGSGGSLEPTNWDDAMAQVGAGLAAANGRTVILGGNVGPSLGGVIDGFAAASGAKRVVYEPFAHEALRAGTAAVFGVASLPIFDPGKADLIIDLGSDFLSTGLSPTENARQYADARSVKTHKSGGTRMISFGPRLNFTTTSADKWIAARAGSEPGIAFALAKAVLEAKGAPAGADAAALQGFLADGDVSKAASDAGIEASDLAEVVDALLHAENPLILPPGVAYTGSNATSTAAAVMLTNALVGAIGNSVAIPPAPAGPSPATLKEIQALVADMKAGKVGALLIHDSNPVYSLPAEIGFSEALEKVSTVVSFASLADETADSAGFVLPDHTTMESWGDSAPRPGVRSVIQPTVRPLLDTRALGDTLLELGRSLGGEMPEGSFRTVVENNWSDVNWREALASGGVFTDTEIAPLAIQADFSGLGLSSSKLGGKGGFTLVAFPHHFLGDGRGAALPWLQEIPDPVTKLQWNSWVEMSFATAEKLGVGFGDVVKVSTAAGTVESSVLPRGGIRDDTIAMPLGQGHTVGLYASMEIEGDHGGWITGPIGAEGQPGVARGANVMAALPAAQDETGGRVWLGTRADVSKTGRFRRLALSQWTDNQRGRKLAQAASLAQVAGHGDDHHGAHHDEPPHTFTAAYDADPDQPYRWGLVIDNDRCNGCSACVASCSIENNIPVVGEAQAIQHRDMAWIRVEKYVGDGDQQGGGERRPVPNREKLGELDVRYIPMPCQQCGAAPCEAVCPTLATYHNKEGLNGMIYNRCAGTRYCANNCVYKVRRFNYFDYGNENFPGLLGLMLNPDVTVRQQGVMEKCSFCVQRIEGARQLAKDEGRDIRDGEVQTACQQACPTNAITFGNLRDESSKVVAEANEPERSYHLLQELNTRSAITYLAQVTRDDNEGKH